MYFSVELRCSSDSLSILNVKTRKTGLRDFRPHWFCLRRRLRRISPHQQKFHRRPTVYLRHSKRSRSISASVLRSPSASCAYPAACYRLLRTEDRLILRRELAEDLRCEIPARSHSPHTAACNQQGRNRKHRTLTPSRAVEATLAILASLVRKCYVCYVEPPDYSLICPRCLLALPF